MNRLYRHRLTLNLLLILFVACINVQADSGQQPIEITSDSVRIDDLKGTATYSGDVTAVQGGFELHADQLTLVRHQNIDSIVATGNPAVFHQQPADGTEEIHGQGKKAHYLLDEGILVLEVDASITQGQNTFTSERIRYDTRNAVVTAGQAASSNSRVTSVIHPRSDEASPPP
ncbi:MAG TPA: lipopolysaccharide transport periplasmic protein LptA [Chromatiales bacterium]|nr:lipopolysaccharide transport periplasmic protein LptA [Chromatiales bacterium]